MKVCRLWEHLLLNFVYVHLYTVLPPKEHFNVPLASFCESLSEFRWLPRHYPFNSMPFAPTGVIGFYITHSPFLDVIVVFSLIITVVAGIN